MLKTIFFLYLLSIASYAQDNSFVNLQSINIEKTKTTTKKEYTETMRDIDKLLKNIDLGYLWLAKGMLLLNDYNFNDGIIVARPAEAEKCFRKAFKRNSQLAAYYLAVSLLKQNKMLDALQVLKNKMNFIKNNLNNKYFKNIYIPLAQLYSSVVIDQNLKVKYIQKAISLSYYVGYVLKDDLVQLELSVLYAKLKKSKPSAYFLEQACLKGTSKKVVSYCKKKTVVKKKICRECEIKKELGLD